MPIYYAYGSALVRDEELREKEALGQMTAFQDALARRPAKAQVEFSTGVLTAKNRLKDFRRAAGIPIFMASSHYLMAASQVTRLVGSLGTLLFDRGPVFNATEPIQFLRAGAQQWNAGFALITDDDMDPATLSGYSVKETGVLANDRGQPYRGDQPFCVISLDGRAVDSYKDFTPTAASAAVLERFFAIGEDQSQPLVPLIDALKLYNDWKFRKKADALKSEMDALGEGSEEYKKRKVEYEAAVKNILDELLRPV